MDLQKKEADCRKRVQLLYLLAAGIVLFPFEWINSLIPQMEGIGYFMAEKYMAVPCLLFFGSALTQRLTPVAKRNLLLSAAAVLWFVVVQMQRHLTGVEPRQLGIFAVGYLLAFPFASVAEDGRKKVGLTCMGWIYVAFSMVLSVSAMLLQMDLLPRILTSAVMWDGGRAALFMHPNGSAGVLMVGIGFTLYFLVGAGKKWQKWVLAALTVLQFLTIVLTNSRTSIFLTSCMIGGTVFFTVWKGGWKRFLAGAAAAVVVIATLTCAHSFLYDLHTEALIDKLMARSEQQIQEHSRQAAPSAEAQEGPVHVNEQTGEVTLVHHGQSTQGDLSSDMKTLNGRTLIWRAAFETLRDNPSYKIWGTEYAAAEISYRNTFPVVNAHNSWIQTLMLLGIPGLLAAVAYTVLAVWNLWILMWRSREDLGKKVVAMIVICILAASILETYLFVGEVYTNFANFAFFLCTGYLIQWNRKEG